MKKLITSCLGTVLSQSQADSLFRLGVKLAPDEFRRYAFEYAFAPDMRMALQKLAARGLQPDHIVDIGAYHGDWSRMARAIWPQAGIDMIEANLDKRDILEPVARDLKATLHFTLLGPEDGTEVVFHVMESGSSVLEENSPLGSPVRKPENTAPRHGAGRAPGRSAQAGCTGFRAGGSQGRRRNAQTLSGRDPGVSLLEINKGAPLFAEVVGFMRERNFEVYDILGLHRRPLDNATNQVDLLFVPSDSDLLKDTRHF